MAKMGLLKLLRRLSLIVIRPSPKLDTKPSYDYMSASSAPNSPKSARSNRRKSSAPAVFLPPAPDAQQDPAAYLRSIYAVRERCQLVMEKARQNELVHFDVHLDKFQEVAQYIVTIIQRDFGTRYSTIPPHGRWQHFDVGGETRVDALLKEWASQSIAERTRRVLDLFVVSVLLDAGAGNQWKYTAESGEIYSRSEGLAVASLEMFKKGYFSSNEAEPCQVDSQGLKNLTAEKLGEGLQVSPENPIAGLEGRTSLLVRLGDAMSNQRVFGNARRPGYLIDYLMSHEQMVNTHGKFTVPLPVLWDALMTELAPIWPAGRTKIGDVSLGDAWPCKAMPESPPVEAWENIVPFHKLTQWLTYSLMVPMTKLMSIEFAGAELMTGLPEYRNGGLLVDMGLLTLKPEDHKRGLVACTTAEEKEVEEKHVEESVPEEKAVEDKVEESKAEELKVEDNKAEDGKDEEPKVTEAVEEKPVDTAAEIVPTFTPDDDVIVEWRAVTVGFLDDLLIEVNNRLGLYGDDELTLPQMLEAGSWKGGREIAKKMRPNTGQPPIMILSDGTVF